MIKKNVAFLTFILASSFASADVPIVDYSSDSTSKSVATAAPSAPAISTTNLSSDQRINKLEQQIDNINSQNFVSKIDEIQQRLQKLSGQIEDQEHKIEQINSQLRSFYQDLNQRLEKPKADNTESVVEPTTPAAVISTVSSSGDEIKPRTDKDFLKEQQMYQTAIDMLSDKKYETCGNKLREYLKLYPNGIYVAKTHYWLGEINFLQKRYDAAEEEFKTVMDKYPKSKCASDALLKLALTHHNQGREAQSKKELGQVIKRFPSTSAAKLAKLQLEGNN